MKFGWIGFHREGLPALQGVLERGYRVEAVLTLRPDLAAKRSGATDYWTFCRELGVPLHEVANINDQASLELLRGRDLDIVFVIGWTQIVRSPALRLARIGMIGAHASLLPRNRGRAPINWTLIRGEQQTGNSLIWLAEGVDRGDIIDQTVIPITPYDTCESLYHQVATSNRDMILRVLPQLMIGKRPGRPQPHTDEPELPGRRPEDGLLDWSKPHARRLRFRPRANAALSRGIQPAGRKALDPLEVCAPARGLLCRSPAWTSPGPSVQLRRGRLWASGCMWQGGHHPSGDRG